MQMGQYQMKPYNEFVTPQTLESKYRFTITRGGSAISADPNFTMEKDWKE